MEVTSWLLVLMEVMLWLWWRFRGCSGGAVVVVAVNFCPFGCGSDAMVIMEVVVGRLWCWCDCVDLKFFHRLQISSKII